MQNNKKYSISFEQISDLVERIEREGGRAVQTDEGCLGMGNWVLIGAEGFYSFVIREEYLNEWSSRMIIIRYKQLPKKYLKEVGEYDDRDFEE